jgi:hypothetical protein
MKTIYCLIGFVLAVCLMDAKGQIISGRSNAVRIDVSSIPKVSPPEVVWLTPDHSPMETTEASVKVKIGINTHPKIKLKSVKLFKSGLAVSSLVDSSDPERSKYARLVEASLEMTAGPNELKVVAENERGEITTQSRIINVTLPIINNIPTYADLGISSLPVYHALIVGVSDYQYSGQGLPNLDKPVKDAESLYNVLTSKYAFDINNVTLLKNPTREQLIDAFDALTRKVTEKDNVLVFYAGHGHHDKETGFGFWLPADAKRDSRSAWVANSQIKDYIGALKAKHSLLITDACFSGSIFKTRKVDAMSTALKIHDIYKDKSRKAMTSGNLSEVPDESYFIKYLLKALEENDQVFLTSTNLFTRIFEPVTNNTTTTPLHGVIQGAGDEGGDFIFFKKM